MRYVPTEGCSRRAKNNILGMKKISVRPTADVRIFSIKAEDPLGKHVHKIITLLLYKKICLF